MLYRNLEEHQLTNVNDFMEGKDKDENLFAQKGATKKEGGQMVLGIKFIAYRKKIEPPEEKD